MTEHSQEKRVKDPKEIYGRLRNRVLTAKRPRRINTPSEPTEAWGVLMDWGVVNGTVTVMSIIDGSASMYFSNGSGFIGGEGIAPVRAAAERAVAETRKIRLPQQPSREFPLPAPHGVNFYVLTDAGVYAIHTTDGDLRAVGHPLGKLEGAMQEIITQFRLWRGSGLRGKKQSKKPN